MLRNGDVSLFGRDEDREAIAQRLEEGGLLLVGPRRIGKTELLKQLVADPPSDSVAVRVDLEGLTDVATAVERVAESLWRSDLAPRRQMKEWLADLRKLSVAGLLTVEKERTLTGNAWDALEELLDTAVQHVDDDLRLVLFLDEVPWWLDGLARGRAADGDDEGQREAEGLSRVRQALAQLRYLRQREGLASRLRLVVTGSVGLAGLASSAGASAELNDLWPYELRPLEPHAGRALFEYELAARGIGVDDEVSAEAYRLAGGSPHWIKQLASKIRKRSRTTAADVGTAVDQLLSARMRHLFQDEAQHHLERRHGRRAPLLRALLSAASASDHGAGRAALLTAGLRHASARGDVERGLVQLVDEFYLEAEGDRFRFANPLFRRWWERYGHWQS